VVVDEWMMQNNAACTAGHLPCIVASYEWCSRSACFGQLPCIEYAHILGNVNMLACWPLLGAVKQAVMKGPPFVMRVVRHGGMCMETCTSRHGDM